ncbi:hypothetical protein COO60DRAFT_1678474, partial [Scenedesmus sp. NREL 46B-D3]
PFTVSELLGKPDPQGLYESVGPVISHGVKAEKPAVSAETRQVRELYAQFIVINLPVINGVYTKDVLHEITSGSWPPFLGKDFIKALGGPQEAAKRLFIFGLLHSPCLSVHMTKGAKRVQLEAGDVVKLCLSGGKGRLRIVGSQDAEFISGCVGYGSARGKHSQQKRDNTHLSRSFYGRWVVQVEALLHAAGSCSAGSDGEYDVAQAWLVLQRYPRGFFPHSGKFAVPITCGSITKLQASECKDHMKELEKLLPELTARVQSGGSAAVTAGSGPPLQLQAGSTVKITVPFTAAGSADSGAQPVRSFSRATAKNMTAMADILIRTRLCPNRQQVPQIQASSKEYELLVDEEGLAVFAHFEVPTVAGSYDLLVDVFIKAGTQNDKVKPLQLSLDNCVQVLPGQLQLVEPAWGAIRRGSTATSPATVLRLGTAAQGDERLYHLPVALYDGGTSKCANRAAVVAVKMVSSRYRTAADDQGLPGQLGDLLLSFFLELAAKRLPFVNMRLDAKLKVVVQGMGDGSTSSAESKPWDVVNMPGWPSSLGIRMAKGELRLPGDGATALAPVENGQSLSTVHMQLLDAYANPTVPFDSSTGVAELQCLQLPLLSFSSIHNSGKAQPIKLHATFAAELAVHSTRNAAMAGTASSRQLPRPQIALITVEPSKAPVELQLVRLGTAAAAAGAAAVTDANVLASCKRDGSAETQLQLEAGSSTDDLALVVRNDCGELLCVKDMQLEMQGTNTMTHKFNVKIAMLATPCSSSSTASLEPAAAAESRELPQPLRSGVGIGGMIALHFYDQYGNLQAKEGQQRAFGSSFPELTAAAVGQTGGMAFLLQDSTAGAAAAALAAAVAAPLPAYLGPPSRGQMGQLDGKHSLSGVLLPGPLQRFELETGEIIPGLLGGITFKYSISDSGGELVWQAEHVGEEVEDVDADAAGVRLSQMNVVLPSTDRWAQ